MYPQSSVRSLCVLRTVFTVLINVSTVHVSTEQCLQSTCPQNGVHCPCVQIKVSFVHIYTDQCPQSIKSALCLFVHRTVPESMCPQKSITLNMSTIQCHCPYFHRPVSTVYMATEQCHCPCAVCSVQCASCPSWSRW